MASSSSTIRSAPCNKRSNIALSSDLHYTCMQNIISARLVTGKSTKLNIGNNRQANIGTGKSCSRIYFYFYNNIFLKNAGVIYTKRISSGNYNRRHRILYLLVLFHVTTYITLHLPQKINRIKYSSKDYEFAALAVANLGSWSVDMKSFYIDHFMKALIDAS